MRKWIPLITIALGTFMLLVDVTIVNVALPDMATDLRTSFSALQWVIDIYALSLAALLLGVGAISDRVGRRPVYVAGLIVFAAASLAAGLAPDPTVLIAARGVQGIGGAAMFATTTALISTSYEGRDRGIAFGVWGAVNGAAAAAGPILGGLLTTGLSWRWIFFVNLPVSIAAVALGRRHLRGGEPRRSGRIDVAGMLAFTAFAGALTFALTRAPDAGWGSAQTLALLGASAAALVVFLVAQTRAESPLLELGLLRRGPLGVVLVGGFMLSVAAFAYLTYVSLWLQSVRGLSAIGAGAAVIPLSLASLLVSLTVGRRLHGDRARWAIAGGLALIGLGALLQAHLSADSTALALTPGLVVAGIGVGLATPVLASAALGAVPPERVGMAAGALNTARQLGYALAIAGLGVLVQSRIGDGLAGAAGIRDAHAAARAVSGGRAHALVAAAPGDVRGGVDHAVHAAFASGLNTALLISAAAGLAAGALAAIGLRAHSSAASPGQRSAAGQTSR